ncbi:MAG TPA: hypothetical protein VMU84_11075 [Thermoanaerobaculia bacterium]|nr:hypothetical protein [Thermoanaerobaculia bacterium]
MRLALCLFFAATSAVAQVWETRWLAGPRTGGGYADGTGAAAKFSGPWNAAACADAIYVADRGNHAIRRVTREGVVTTYAGALTARGYENGDRTSARFNLPSGIVADAQCNLFITDSGNNAIRKISPDGDVTTIATGLSNPIDLVLAGNGTIYFTNAGNHTIGGVTPDGNVFVHAGTAGQFGRTDGNGAAARFNTPQGITIDASGNLYVAEQINQTIRKISPSRDVTTLLRSGYPVDVVAAPDGTLFVSNRSELLVQRVTSNNTLALVAGGSSKFGFVDATGADARFDGLRGIALDGENLVLVEDGNNAIRIVSQAGEVHTLAGTAPPTGKVDGIGADVRFTVTSDIAVDADGFVYVGDTTAIRRIARDGTTTTLAPTFSGVGSLTFAPSGDLIIADGTTIRRMTRDGVVTTIAGAPNSPGSADGIGSAARFQSVLNLAVGHDGTIYVADAINGAVRKIVGDVVTTVNKTPSALPMGIDVDDEGNAYYWDENNPAIFRVAPDGTRTEIVRDDRLYTLISAMTRAADGTIYLGGGRIHSIYVIQPGSNKIELFAGGDESPGNQNGNALAARFRSPSTLEIAADGRLYVGDGNRGVRVLVRLRTRAARHP